MERTSLTHPLVVDSVETPGGGRIGMTICPGKKQVRAARPGAIETREQEEYVRSVGPETAED